MKTTNAWTLVARRELSVRLRDKTFIGSTLLSLVILVAVFGFQAWNANKASTYDLAVTSQSQQMGQVVVDAAPGIDDKVTVTLVDVADDQSAKAAVTDESADAWLHRTSDGWQLVGKSDVSPGLQDIATQSIGTAVLAANADKVGTDVTALQKGTDVTTDILDGDAEQAGIAKAVGFGMAILFYMSAAIFGMYLAMSVTEEKQSRIVEIIATSIPLRHLLFGKLIAAVALAVGQLLLYAAVAIVGASFTEWGDMLPGLTSGLIWFIVFFIAGFTMIAALYAVSGALASRQEDIQSTSFPVTMLLMVMFFGAMFASGPIVDVLAWIPPFSAILQPMRLVSGEAQWWEALISLGILAAVTVGVILVAERIYRRALMQTGGKLSYKDAWNAEL
ncbi:aromatic ring-opening dioxygenase LigA [Janibacter sp. Soil728]|uniref:ABC transporter permease n=1 Tax=Janibacter sp. Soil728 TaxID=1736393 RepID=UPI0007020A1E|nr:ABC transporter permease [Janibacter sp. Soil728]KRE39418.1 aromatic ring-opening dioxygenase LigA [Janibacter sp. Soil728]